MRYCRNNGLISYSKLIKAALEPIVSAVLIQRTEKFTVHGPYKKLCSNLHKERRYNVLEKMHEDIAVIIHSPTQVVIHSKYCISAFEQDHRLLAA
ncbi:MAG: hypothetical protein COB66_04385 [Coxiella sp. (in: Bacteria)]|nr:MAG: hypothetical protein COB66_04385 [Coxiella sp. (in: g-proteobacteria)]